MGEPAEPLVDQPSSGQTDAHVIRSIPPWRLCLLASYAVYRIAWQVIDHVWEMTGCGENAVYLIFVDEIPGLFFPPNTGPSREAREVLAIASEYFKEAGVVPIPIWRMAHDAGASLAGAARRLGVEAVLLGTSQRGAVWHLLRGNVLRSLVRELPDGTRVWIVN